MPRSSPTYHARLIPVWEHWVVEVSDAHGVHAMVARVTDAENAAREAIAMVLGIDPLSFAVVVEPS